jgi:acetoin utilization deacetylase AcuC-like enzyme
MIIYDEHMPSSLRDFGIEIPVDDSRAVKTYQLLTRHPILGKNVNQWHDRNISEVVTRDDLLRVHSAQYVERLFSEKLEDEIVRTFELIDENGRYHRYNPRNAKLPLRDLFGRILRKVAQTVQSARLALEHGFCFSFSGGMHHAHREYGSGFCLVNDIMIALRKLQAEKRIRTAWVIDVDAHKGDGTAELTLADESVRTLSIHMGHGWPLDGAEFDSQGRLNAAFIPSDIDIPMAAGEDDLYVPRLREGLNQLNEFPRPDLALVVSGADPYEKDELPSTADLKLSLQQLLERDLLVYNFLKERSIPRAYVMAGGYGQSSWEVYVQFLEHVLVEESLSNV